MHVAAILACAVVLGLAGRDAAQAQGSAGTVTVVPGPAYVPDEVLVRFRPGTSPAGATTAHTLAGARTAARLHVVDQLQRVTLPRGVTVTEAIRSYLRHPDVLYAEPNYVVHALALPDDPRFGEQWALRNTGQTGGTPGADIDAPGAWALTTGSDQVVVAVIDTGIDYTHPDLAPNMFRNEADCDHNGVDDDGNGFVDDCYGIDTFHGTSDPMDDHRHGTHAAGIIGAAGNNGVGVVGVNWNVRLLACKFLDDNGLGTIAGAIACLDYVRALKDRGVNIVATSNSWGGAPFSLALYEAIDAQRQRGILFVAGAGNDALEIGPLYPAAFAAELFNVVTVGATTSSDTLAGFSNFGRWTVHLGAPGTDILSTVPGGGYQLLSGTSMATPHVSGVAALLKAQDPTRDWRALKNLLLAGGDDRPALSGVTLTGKRVSAGGALSCADAVLLRRQQPLYGALFLRLGEPLDLAALHIRCAVPDGDVTVTVDPGGEAVILRDDGGGIDQTAGDGVYAATWTPPAVGTYTLTFPGGDVVTVRVSPNPVYQVATAPLDYRVITGTSLDLGDDAAADLTLPFPVMFGGASFDRVFVSANGNVNFSGPFTQPFNYPIGTAPIGELVAPFWDDLAPVPGTAQNVFWAVTGTAPRRELVIEWRNVPLHACADAAAAVTFQVVFFEDRSDVLFNYADTVFGGACAAADRGAHASVGIQTSLHQSTEFSFESASLADGLALRWTNPSPGARVTPTSRDFGVVAVGASADLTFTVQNTGTATLTGSAAGPAPFSVATGGAFSLGPGQSQDVTIRFSPTVDGDVTASVTFASNAGSFQRAVTGTGLAAHTVPSLVSLAPADARAGGPALTLVVSGGEFVAASVVRWNGADRLTTFVSATELQAAIPASDLAAGGTAQVTVFTPAPGGGASGAIALRIGYPAPIVTSLTPDSAPAGGPALALTVHGESFFPVSVVRWDGAARPTTYVSATELRAAIPLGDLLHAGASGLVAVGVFNPEPDGGSAQRSFALAGARALAVTTAGGGGGTVTSSPAGIGCGADCAEAYAPATLVTLTAAPDARSRLSGWSGCDTTSTATCRVSMSANRSVTATFDLLPRPDLQVVSVTAPAGGAVGRPLAVSALVRNTDLAAAVASTLQFYLSPDGTLGAGARLLLSRPTPGLAPGASTTVAATMTIPSDVLPGAYRIVALADAGSVVSERVENNNTGVSAPITVTLYRSELAVTALTVPARSALGQLVAIQNTVRNTGPAPAGAFSLRFHLASDTTLDSSVAVLGVRALGGLAAGALSSATTSLRLPANVSAGQYHVLAVADALGQQVELDEDNNVAVSSAFAVEPYRSELAVTALAPPARAAVGKPIALASTVRNTGLAPAGAFSIRFYLSSDGSLDAGDPVLGTRVVAALTAGAQAPATTSLTIPGNVSAGQYHVIAVVDALGQQPELDETNNVAVSAPFAVEPYRPELAVAALAPPPRGAVGRPITVQNTLGNAGLAPAGAFSVRFHLSADGVLDAADAVLGVRMLAGLAPGTTSAAATTLTLPGNVSAGQYHVIAVVDALGQQLELDETNDVAVSAPFSVEPYRPELGVTALTPPARGGLGQLIAVKNTVTNTGLAPAGAFSVRFHLASDATLDASVAVLGVRALGGLAAGATSAVTTSLRLPGNVSAGQYYVIAVVDALGQQPELDETNDVTVSLPFTVEPYRPELAITALAPPPGGIAGQLIAIPNTVRNTGLAPAGPFSVRVHLASDATLDSSVAVLGTRAVSGLAAGSASAATTALRLPGNIPAGQYYVVAVVDALGQQPELDETNNITVAGPLAITSPPPH